MEIRRLNIGNPVLFTVFIYVLFWDCVEVNSFLLRVGTHSLTRSSCRASVRTARRCADFNSRYSFIATTPLFSTQGDEDTSESNSNAPTILGSPTDVMGQRREIDERTVEDLPLFSFDFNEDDFDRSAIPIPMFTASVVFLWSMAFTYYLYDVGINGFPDV
jgi:hypothetical protein